MGTEKVGFSFESLTFSLCQRYLSECSCIVENKSDCGVYCIRCGVDLNARHPESRTLSNLVQFRYGILYGWLVLPPRIAVLLPL